ncbi:putative acetyltransferase [Maribacter vaceletii]|uniref:Putative acetyltransferase n=1 Tax=Maribacter vaceletii TaxID=1206816 RepID=A0A495EQ30_9FLAO|nr:GNAT family N-acetyltransferase [Maribacter vaceletii]RKR18749.1 putative acetyltransferase [Maribacter vaceletii]
MIRKHNKEDLEQIMDVWNQSSSLAHPFLESSFQEEVRNDMKEIYIPGSDTWVYDEGNRILGFISMIGNEIGGLFVLPNNHSKGIGTKLVNYINNFHDHLEVEVFEKNIIGRSFYKKYGFKIISKFMHEPSNEKVVRLSTRNY